MMEWLHDALSSESVSTEVLGFNEDNIVLPAELPKANRVRLPVPTLTPAHAKDLQCMLADLVSGGTHIAGICLRSW